VRCDKMSLKGDGGWVESLYITARRRCRFMISLAFIRFIKTKRTPKHTFLWKVTHVSHGLDPARLWGWGAGDDTYLHVLLFHPFLLRKGLRGRSMGVSVCYRNIYVTTMGEKLYKNIRFCVWWQGRAVQKVRLSEM
jgi:hypothetical protein